MDQVIVGIGHRKRVGKDTATAMMISMLRAMDIQAARAAFAAKVKDIAYQLYGWAGVMPEEFYERYPDERNLIVPAIGKTVRQIWIDIGTPAMRANVYDRTWIDYLMHNLPVAQVIFVPDLRFPNEFDEIKKHGGLCIKIVRSAIKDTDDVADCALKDETRWDHVVQNDNGIYELRHPLQEVCDLIERKLKG